MLPIIEAVFRIIWFEWPPSWSSMVIFTFTVLKQVEEEFDLKKQCSVLKTLSQRVFLRGKGMR